MISIISSAKSLDCAPISSSFELSEPSFLKESTIVLGKCKTLSAAQLKKIMGISDKLAELNFNRFQCFEKSFSKPAIFTYNGEVYDNLDKNNLTSTHLDFLQTHLLIISGLYGILRPLDNIKPYRLEMATKLPDFGEATLSQYWQDIITDHINHQLGTHTTQYLINLASIEYSSAINKQKLQYPMINIYFKEYKATKLTTIGINAKKARGMMLNFIAKNLIDNPGQLKEFNYHDYSFNEEASTELEWVFIK